VEEGLEPLLLAFLALQGKVVRMTTIEITLPDEIASTVKQAAKERGVSVQDLLQSSVVEKLARDAEFEAAAARVLTKNVELYERLS
jgi:hypothetical protein